MIKAWYLANYHDPDRGYAPRYRRGGELREPEGAPDWFCGRVHSGRQRELLVRRYGSRATTLALGVYDLLREYATAQVRNRRGFLCDRFGRPLETDAEIAAALRWEPRVVREALKILRAAKWLVHRRLPPTNTRQPRPICPDTGATESVPCVDAGATTSAQRTDAPLCIKHKHKSINIKSMHAAAPEERDADAGRWADVGERAYRGQLTAALAEMGFSDAARIVAQHDPEKVLLALEYGWCQQRYGNLRNRSPGPFVRSAIAAGADRPPERWEEYRAHRRRAANRREEQLCADGAGGLSAADQQELDAIPPAALIELRRAVRVGLARLLRVRLRLAPKDPLRWTRLEEAVGLALWREYGTGEREHGGARAPARDRTSGPPELRLVGAG